MSDSNREQRPLLCDDYSDEDLHVRNYNCQRRNRLSISSGRARNHAKGAVNIITRWPGHWSTSAGYWWLGVSMIAITIFIIYNSVITIEMLQPPTKQPKFRTFSNGIKSKSQEVPLPEVYMHLLANNNTDFDLHKYLPHIGVISRKYSSFKYRFVVVLNDTSKDVYDVDDETRNEIALNSLWKENLLKEKPKNSISIEHVSLTTYLNNSPIKKFWRHLPHHLIDFLLRSVAIWEKGGVAFNPLILTAGSPNSNYTQKLHKVLQRYGKYIKKAKQIKSKNKVHSRKNKMRPNNIRDIINALEKEENNDSQHDLNEAENKDDAIIYNKMNNTKEKGFGGKEKSKMIYDKDHHPKTNHFQKISSEQQLNVSDDITKVDNVEITKNILPLFLKYLFHSKPENEIIRNNTNEEILKTKNIDIRPGKAVKPKSVSPSTEENKYENSYETPVTAYRNITKYNSESNMTLTKSDIYDNVSELSIDIKGNIIASRSGCHAFLGTIFSNVIHYTEEETLSDFIISELSLFCKGLITSCSGVDVILV